MPIFVICTHTTEKKNSREGEFHHQIHSNKIYFKRQKYFAHLNLCIIFQMLNLQHQIIAMLECYFTVHLIRCTLIQGYRPWLYEFVMNSFVFFFFSIHFERKRVRSYIHKNGETADNAGLSTLEIKRVKSWNWL